MAEIGLVPILSNSGKFQKRGPENHLMSPLIAALTELQLVTAAQLSHMI